jgi:hypothetical protein
MIGHQGHANELLLHVGKKGGIRIMAESNPEVGCKS